MASSVTVIKTVDDRREFPGFSKIQSVHGARTDSKDRQTAAAFQNEAEESDESEDETAGERTRTRVGRTRGGMKVAARIGEKLRREIGSGRRPRVGDG